MEEVLGIELAHTIVCYAAMVVHIINAAPTPATVMNARVLFDDLALPTGWLCVFSALSDHLLARQDVARV